MEIRYYTTSSGRSPIKDFIGSLSGDVQEQYLEAIHRLRNGEMLQLPGSKTLTGVHKGLHELRVKDHRGIYRVFYYLKVKEAIYMLHAFKKKTQKTPQRELKIALKRLKEL